MTLPTPVPFTGEYIPGSEITLTVCQGIGDIIWVWQKWFHYCDILNFKILSVTDGEVCRRAMPWLKLLPKVGKVSFWVDHPHRYRDLAARPSIMQEVWEQWRGGAIEVEYACNKWLEEGVRLDEIDPGCKIVDRLDWQGREYELPYPNPIVLFVSGDTRHDFLRRDREHHLWSVAEWVEYVTGFREKYGLDLPVVVIGANFDIPIIGPLCDALKAKGIPATPMIGQEPERVVYLMTRSVAFLGYQSGLNVIADLVGCRQMMMYFVKLAPMRYSWCNRNHIGTKFFASTFKESPREVLEKHEIFP